MCEFGGMWDWRALGVGGDTLSFMRVDQMYHQDKQTLFGPSRSVKIS